MGGHPLATVSTAEPQFRLAVTSCVAALRRMAGYELDPPIARRLQELSEQKEYLDKDEHDELLALVAFSRQRTIEKLEARVALDRLREILPEMVEGTRHGVRPAVASGVSSSVSG